jgi:hypothetical protein
VRRVWPVTNTRSEGRQLKAKRTPHAHLIEADGVRPQELEQEPADGLGVACTHGSQGRQRARVRLHSTAERRTVTQQHHHQARQRALRVCARGVQRGCVQGVARRSTSRRPPSLRRRAWTAPRWPRRRSRTPASWAASPANNATQRHVSVWTHLVNHRGPTLRSRNGDNPITPSNTESHAPTSARATAHL